MPANKLSMSLIIVVVSLFVGQSALADGNLTNEKTYTLNADFDEGVLVDVNHDTPDQLQLNSTATPFAFVNVVATGRGTIVRIDADSGDIIGEYRTAPIGYSASPSRTSVDSAGNVWTANLDEAGSIDGKLHGSVVKIGIVVGGTRVKKEEEEDDEGNDDTSERIIVEDPSGAYLAPPFQYSTCVDRDGDGLIRTSLLKTGSDWPDVLDWSDSGKESQDGLGGTDGSLVGNVENAEDECILLYQRLADAEEAHHVSVDATDSDNVWVGGYPGTRGLPKMFYKLNASTAVEEDSFDARDYGCGGFGGLVDRGGVLWSASLSQSMLLHYNTRTREVGCIAVDFSYGLGVDTLGFIWNSSWLNSDFDATEIVKVDPVAFAIFPGFPIETSENRQNQGVAVTPADNNVWVAQGFGREVLRLDESGGFLKEIPLEQALPGGVILNGDNPTGVAVDANGKVWVTNLNSDNVMRIDPTGGADKLGAVDLTIELDVFDAPDNYSDMTGAVNIKATSTEGSWTVIYDSGTPSNMWDTITWNTEPEASVPEGAGITVEARVADVEEELAGQMYQEVFNGELLSLTGMFIQIRATLTPNSEGKSPILSDLTVVSVPVEETETCKMDDDDDIDIYDILPIFFSIGDTAEAGDPRDWDRDGTVTIIDARGCVLECTNQYCAPGKKTVLVE